VNIIEYFYLYFRKRNLINVIIKELGFYDIKIAEQDYFCAIHLIPKNKDIKILSIFYTDKKCEISIYMRGKGIYEEYYLDESYKISTFNISKNDFFRIKKYCVLKKDKQDINLFLDVKNKFKYFFIVERQNIPKNTKNVINIENKDTLKLIAFEDKNKAMEFKLSHNLPLLDE